MLRRLCSAVPVINNIIEGDVVGRIIENDGEVLKAKAKAAGTTSLHFLRLFIAFFGLCFLFVAVLGGALYDSRWSYIYIRLVSYIRRVVFASQGADVQNTSTRDEGQFCWFLRYELLLV